MSHGALPFHNCVEAETSRPNKARHHFGFSARPEAKRILKIIDEHVNGDPIILLAMSVSMKAEKSVCSHSKAETLEK